MSRTVRRGSSRRTASSAGDSGSAGRPGAPASSSPRSAEASAASAPVSRAAPSSSSAWALLELARIELQRGRRLLAEETLAHAEELLGAARDAGTLPALASALRRELDARAPARSAEPLSPAELAVLRLLPHRSVREIAEALYLSANTIKSHIRAIYRKLAVHTREDAVARATALGMLDDVAGPGGPLQ